MKPKIINSYIIVAEIPNPMKLRYGVSPWNIYTIRGFAAAGNFESEPEMVAAASCKEKVGC